MRELFYCVQKQLRGALRAGDLSRLDQCLKRGSFYAQNVVALSYRDLTPLVKQCFFLRVISYDLLQSYVTSYKVAFAVST